MKQMIIFFMIIPILGGCAATVKVTSEPSDALVYKAKYWKDGKISGISALGKTPCSFSTIDSNSALKVRWQEGDETRWFYTRNFVSGVKPHTFTVHFDKHKLNAGEPPVNAYAIYKVSSGPLAANMPGEKKINKKLIQNNSFANEQLNDLSTIHEDSLPDIIAKSDTESIDFGEYYALVIGNNDYQYVTKLETPVNDAKSVAEVLQLYYGFNVDLLLNADRRRILIAFDKLRSRLASKDNLLIYYAGHGYYDKDAERGYWLPVEARCDTKVDWISNADITDNLKALKAKHVIVIADSCYSGALTRSIHVKLQNPEYLKRIARKKARTVLTSGGMEPVMDIGGGNHSVFAKAFIKALKENSSIMDGTLLFIKIRRPVMVNSHQTPQYSDIRLAGHDGGDFLFVRKK